MIVDEFRILTVARAWEPHAITADEIAYRLHGGPYPRGRCTAIANRLRSLVRRDLFTVEPDEGFSFYRLTEKGRAIVDA